jgi:hypothetical protein
MFGIGNPLLLAVCLGGGVIALLGVGPFFFQAGCALANVTERGYLRSLPIYAATVLLCLPLATALIWFAGTYDADPTAWFGAMRLAAMIASLLVTWILSAVIYSLFLAASVKKGLLIAGFELLLMGLLALLVSAVVLIILALVQILSKPPEPAKKALVPLPTIVRAVVPAVLS